MFKSITIRYLALILMVIFFAFSCKHASKPNNQKQTQTNQSAPSQTNTPPPADPNKDKNTPPPHSDKNFTVEEDNSPQSTLSGESMCEDFNQIINDALELHLTKTKKDLVETYQNSISESVNHPFDVAIEEGNLDPKNLDKDTIAEISTLIKELKNNTTEESIRNCDHIKELFNYFQSKILFKEISEQLIFEGTLKGFFSSLDSMSRFLVASDIADSPMFEFAPKTPIGIEFKMKPTYIFGQKIIELEIEDVLPGPVQDKIQSGDILTKIDGVKLEDIGQNEYKGDIRSIFHELMKEKPKEITLTVRRASDNSEQTINITKDNARSLAVTKKEISIKDTDKVVGYIRLREFSLASGTEIYSNLKDFSKKDNMLGIIFDLRVNGGGSLSDATDIIDSLIKENDSIITALMSKNPSNETQKKYKIIERAEIKTEITGAITNLPIVVLVDNFSASGSDLFALALKDYNRAVIVGDRTFGKGIAQSEIHIESHFFQKNIMSITTEYFYGPSGASPQQNGVTPHIKIVDENLDQLIASYTDKQKSNQQPVQVRMETLGNTIKAPKNISTKFNPPYKITDIIEGLSSQGICNGIKAGSQHDDIQLECAKRVLSWINDDSKCPNCKNRWK